jgi:catechol 2,3-dioxygenase-like lactoylglutathione lyase family enzyme
MAGGRAVAAAAGDRWNEAVDAAHRNALSSLWAEERNVRTPILNHLALTVPRHLVSDTPERQRLLEFYETVFGWRAIDLMGIEGERLVLHLHQITHFLYLVGGETPTTGGSGDHFGIEVYERDALTAIVDRAKAFRAECDPAVEIIDIAREDYGTIHIHNAYVRYLLPLMVEVQYYEGVEAGQASGAP